jgi:hypothetical protein
LDAAEEEAGEDREARMKRVKASTAVEQLFPHPRGRRAGDEAVDALPVTSPMTHYLDAWEGAYFAVAGDSPFRARTR